jgi:hypothetical protein
LQAYLGDCDINGDGGDKDGGGGCGENISANLFVLCLKGE